MPTPGEALFLISVVFAGLLVFVHFRIGVSPWFVGPALVIYEMFFEAAGLARHTEKVSLGLLGALLVTYSSLLYVLLCEKMLRGWADKLTKRRGKSWVKELDYLYLLLGTVGVLGTLNRLDGVIGSYASVDVYAPLVLASAIVVRLIKTRAEVEEWNLLEAPKEATKEP